MKKFAMLLLTAVLTTAFVGCTCPMEQPAPVVDKAPAPAPAAAPAPKPAPKQGVCGDYSVSRDYLSTGAIRLDKVMPQTVQLDAPFEYTIVLTNMTDMMLTDVVVKERVPDSLKDIKSAPAGKLSDGVIVWTMDTLAPRAADKITVSATATEAGCLQTCADVTYLIPACAKTNVVQPALALTKSAPDRVTLCEAIPFQFVVTNKGTGTATNVRIADTLADGLMTQDGKKTIDLPIGSLAAGQSQTRTVMVKAAKTGTYKNQATALADGNLKTQSETTTTVVTQPVLTIKKSGPKVQYLGRSVAYDITVTNTGDAAAVETVLTDTIPAGVSDLKASDGAQMAQNQVTWKLGNLAPKASKTVTVSYLPAKDGTYSNTAKATAVCADGVSDSAQTEIKGIPAILLEVVDLTDPIEVGGTVTYLITVTNQGTATGTGILIKAMLEETMSFISADGATNGTLDGDTVTFSKLASLAPKAKATWRVSVKAIEEADARFRVTMNSDQLGRDVEETEATNFYE